MRIDAHQHFWKFDPVRDNWIDDNMSTIQQDFLPDDLRPLLDKYQFDGCIAVQANQSEQENDFLLRNAKQSPYIKGIVGWVDLQSPQVDNRLEYYSSLNEIKGFRHVLQGENNRALMLTSVFMNGISKLKRYNFTYDLLIYTDQLIYMPDFISAFPEQKFVIDHLAKPSIKTKEIDDWAKHIKAVAHFDNVWCKVSGMITEADWKNWQTDDFKPYLDIVYEAFGDQRLMFGSDWPVCNVAGGYSKMFDMVSSYITTLSQQEQSNFWGNNAASFYNL